MKSPEQHYRLSFGVFVLNLEQNQEISLVGFFILNINLPVRLVQQLVFYL